MLRCSTSLWSADLSDLAAEIKRVEPFSERFHLDVADGHYVKNLLFFPDLLAQLRRHTRLPFEVHLMVAEPLAWIDPFVEAGADIVLFCFDAAQHPGQVLRAIKARGRGAGFSLRLSEPIEPICRISGFPAGRVSCSPQSAAGRKPAIRQTGRAALRRWAALPV